MGEIGRNKPLDFAQRTMKNLEFIHSAKRASKDVHEVTQLMNSMLGLIVFIQEADKKKKTNLPEPEVPWRGDEGLETIAGLPMQVDVWDQKKPRSFEQLLSFLRNAIAHRNVKFSSDSGSWDDVIVTFWNYPQGSTSLNWVVSMHAQHLKDFCDYLLIKQMG